MTETAPGPVRLTATGSPGRPDPAPALAELYRGFELELLVPFRFLMEGDGVWTAVPSWENFSVIYDGSGAPDLFTPSDAPIFEALRLDRAA